MSRAPLFPDHVESARSAVISPCGLYRYLLTRSVNPDRGTRCVFVMLNPSTADATEDDPTIRACMAFAERWECGWLDVVNLYAFRATEPADLAKAANPSGPDNWEWLINTARNGDLVVAAWGSSDPFAKQLGSLSASAMMPDLLRCEMPLWHLGLNKDGNPRHPLYVKRSTPLTLWSKES